jgi:hypothetical protein
MLSLGRGLRNPGRFSAAVAGLTPVMIRRGSIVPNAHSGKLAHRGRHGESLWFANLESLSLRWL